MLSFPMCSSIRQRWLLLLSFALVSACLSQAFAQGGVGSTRGLPDAAGGVHTIQGRVYSPSGRRSGAGIAVKLEGNINGSRTASTDIDGSFLFNSLPAGQYSIVVDAGSDFEPAKQTVTIYGSTGGAEGAIRAAQTLSLDIHLVPKGAAAAEEKLFAGLQPNAVTSYKKGLQLAQAGKTSKAVEELERAVASEPGFGLALTQLGIQYLKLGQAAKAVEVLATAVKALPEEYEPRLNYGIALLGLKKFPEAEEQLTAAIKKNPAPPTAHMYLGMALMNQKKLNDAQRELEAAVSTNSPEVAQAHRYLGGVYWGNREYKRAADELETYLKLNPKAPDAEIMRNSIKELRAKQN